LRLIGIMAQTSSFAAGGLFDRVTRPLRHGDLALALGVIGILVVLILPRSRSSSAPFRRCC
jgi:hypothetical protein